MEPLMSIFSGQAFLNGAAVGGVGIRPVVENTVKKPSCVFLWVSLVVRSLMEALIDGDGLFDLQAIIDRLPSDISSRNISASSELLAIFRAAKTRLDSLTLWLADDKQPLNLRVGDISPQTKLGILNLMKRRVDSRTRGILEVSPQGTVDVLHRTARDWLAQPEVWKQISSTIKNSESFDPYLLLLKGETLRAADKTNYYGMHRHSLCIVVHRTLYASQVRDTPEFATMLTEILDLYDTEVSKMFAEYFAASRSANISYSRLLSVVHWSSSLTLVRPCLQWNSS
ncbi:hypothetical protein B0T17DRAFT_511756 [Bombardia bombarda]|uniref:DUF7791 domain-containing protein n=1 Tax=Bombardia bombarda TaxID=252184 RepID=A0AA39TMC6_9PEZI|nr:hypothetical protein B0T17DRAFT_511756 [Bombardia bombarda]